MVELLERCDFRPFVVTDDGTTLVLRRPRSLRDTSTRVIHLMFLAMMVAAFVASPYLAWDKYSRTGEPRAVIYLPFLMLLSWGAIKLCLFAIRLEAARRIECRSGELILEGRGVFRRWREHLRGVAGLEARIVRTRVRYHVVRWMYLRVGAGGQFTDLGYLELDPAPGGRREAAAQNAAALLAARLGVPLTLRGEDDRFIPAPRLVDATP